MGTLGAVLAIVFGMVVYVFWGGILKLLLVLYGFFFFREGVVSYSVILLQTHCVHVLHSQCVKGDIKQRSIMGPFDGNGI